MLTQSPSQTVGPFFHDGLILGENHLVNEQTRGERITLTGRVLDGDGQPVPDAMIEIWQADAEGIYAHVDDPLHAQADPAFRGYGRADTVDAGRYVFETIKPGAVVRAGQPVQAPHINVHVFARGMLIHVHTRVYFADVAANDSDAILNAVPAARRDTLLAQRTLGAATYTFDIVLQGEHETAFFEA